MYICYQEAEFSFYSFSPDQRTTNWGSNQTDDIFSQKSGINYQEGKLESTSRQLLIWVKGLLKHGLWHLLSSSSSSWSSSWSSSSSSSSFLGHRASTSILHHTWFFATGITLSQSQPHIRTANPCLCLQFEQVHRLLGTLSGFAQGLHCFPLGMPCSNLILVISNTDFSFCSMFSFIG